MLFGKVMRGDAAAVDELLNTDTDLGRCINDKNSDHDTALAVAAKMGNVAVVKILVSHGAHPLVGVRQSKNTPLHLAAIAGHTAVVEALLEGCRSPPPASHGASRKYPSKTQGSFVDTRNEAGDTPLMFACAAGKLGPAHLLLHQGASLLLQNHSGMTPLICASGSSDGAQQAKGDGATSSAGSGTKAAQLVEALLGSIDGEEERRKMMQLQDSHGNTALHAACQAGLQPVVEVLLQAGSTIGTKNKKGHTAAQEAELASYPACARRVEEEMRRQLERAQAALEALLEEETKLKRSEGTLSRFNDNGPASYPSLHNTGSTLACCKRYRTVSRGEERRVCNVSSLEAEI